MKNKLLAVLSLVLILCSILAVPVLALEAEPEEPLDPVDPETPYVDISMYSCGCSINSNGRAYCSSYAETAHPDYKVYVSISLQRYKDGYWQAYAGPWSGSGTGYAGVYKYYYVVSGYYYRTSSSVTVRTADGDYVESAHLLSASKYY